VQRGGKTIEKGSKVVAVLALRIAIQIASPIRTVWIHFGLATGMWPLAGQLISVLAAA
jgi:hypothetical protein